MLETLPKRKRGLIVGAWHECACHRADIESDAVIATFIRDTDNGDFSVCDDYDWVYIDGFEDHDYGVNVLISAAQSLYLVDGSVICGRHDKQYSAISAFIGYFGNHFKVEINKETFKLTYNGN